MIFEVILGILGLSLAQCVPLDGIFVNSPLPNQGFFYSYEVQPRGYNPNDLNRPLFSPELGLQPQYHNLVYNYVKDFAGAEPPAHVNTFQPNIVESQDLSPSYGNVPVEDKLGSDTAAGVKDEVTDKPGLSEHFPPSDFFTLPNTNTRFYGHLNNVKLRSANPKTHPTSLPPIAGVVSNYVLLRSHSNPQNLLQLPGTVKDNESELQHIKRQIPDNSDGVVILAEPNNGKMSDQIKEETEGNQEEEPMGAQPGIAQSKPAAIALAGPGGMAQASPVGTALVGQGGLAVAAPSGTAVAGPAGQGVIPIQIGSGEKQKKEAPEKKEESDGF